MRWQCCLVSLSVGYWQASQWSDSGPIKCSRFLSWSSFHFKVVTKLWAWAKRGVTAHCFLFPNCAQAGAALPVQVKCKLQRASNKWQRIFLLHSSLRKVSPAFFALLNRFDIFSRVDGDMTGGVGCRWHSLGTGHHLFGLGRWATPPPWEAGFFLNLFLSNSPGSSRTGHIGQPVRVSPAWHQGWPLCNA